ncbi:ABC transporter permease [Paenibacillus bovis]|uniref:ABC transporter permease n=1 Tax=Paenibacillus bovis TaxID=1616788 RepID=A0A172ZB53_9BACL|nr:ABC transporter permease [Paenibacillus bovis]ANF94871.1 ABC transporter permease [Paenibacillus bovis]
MTFRQFAYHNVVRNKRLYAAYFLSSMFTVMVFFTFAIFAYHPLLADGQVNHNVQGGMSTAKWMIYVFSFFFVLYSMSSFLKTRKREFGLLMMQGMSPGQLRQMVFLENIIIGFAATLGGIGLGLVFAKAILLAGEHILVIEGGLNFYFPVRAIIVTCISFFILFLLISLFISSVLRSGKLIDLIKGSQKARNEPKASMLLSLLVLILIGTGYTLALLARGSDAFILLIPVSIVVSVGSYLLFTQLSVYIIRRLKSKESFFWSRTNMLLLSDLSYRMKDNARTFFLVCIVSTVSFCAIGSLYGLQSVVTRNVALSNPYVVSYLAKSKEVNVQKYTDSIDHTLQKHNIRTTRMNQMLTEYNMKEDSSTQTIVSLSMFNQLAELSDRPSIQLNTDETVAVTPFQLDLDHLNLPATTSSGIAVKPDRLIQSGVLGVEGISFVVPDHIYAQLGKPADYRSLYVWAGDQEQQEVLLAGSEIYNELDPSTTTHRIMVPGYDLNQELGSYGAILFIGLFIGIVFFVSAGSFLYFRLYSDLDEDKQKFRSIAKLGLTIPELNRVLNRQIILLFFAPIVVAMLHGAIALTTLANMFQTSLFKESLTVLGIFFLIQLVYFLIVRFFYIKQVRAAIR